ncbi:MAG: hypothetical protein ACM31C_04055 [Acidobacteriota bacterium]
MSLCAGCSFAWHDSHVRSPPLSIADCPSRIRGVLDTVGTAGLAFVDAEAYLHRNDADSAAMIWVLPLAMATVAYASSAVYGYVKPGQCERSFAVN